jgi:hypothetical protein
MYFKICMSFTPYITPTTPLPNLECHSKVFNYAPKGVIFIHLWCSKYSHHFTIVIYDRNMFIVEATVQKLTNLSYQAFFLCKLVKSHLTFVINIRATVRSIVWCTILRMIFSGLYYEHITCCPSLKYHSRVIHYTARGTINDV